MAHPSRVVSSRVSWLITIVLSLTGVLAHATPCDVDADGDIDRIDYLAILADIGERASGPNDPRDADRNGRILSNDAQLCARRCTLALCDIPTNKAPIAKNDAVTTALDTRVRINVIANDRDRDGRIVPKTVRIVTKPKHGKVTRHRNGTVTYRPALGFQGRDRFRYRVKDNDGARSNAAWVRMAVESGNRLPMADAGPDFNLATGALVTLNGSNSFDPDGDPLTFSWQFLSVPPASTVTNASLANPATAAPSFTTDADGPYELALEVSDGQMTDVDTATVTAATANVPPNANAGPDQNAIAGQIVDLDGQVSSDPDSGPAALGFRWFFAAVPLGSTLTDANITGAATALASFAPDVAGAFRVGLEVDDGADTDQDEVLVTAALPNVAPNAGAGSDIVVQLGPPAQTATLDGTASNDPDNGPSPLSFLWTFVNVPPLSAITDAALLGAATATPSFTPDVAGFYLLRLDVSDSDLTDMDQVQVKANVAPNAADDSYTLVENTTLTEPAPGILANDTDGNSDPLTAALVTDVASGALALNADGSFTYTPNTDFEGTDSFTYLANDGSADSNVAMVTLTITHANEAPVLTAGATLNSNEGDPATGIDATVTVNDVDSVNLTGATVQITGNYQNGEDVLSFINIGAITGNFVAATGTLILSGTDTLANYQLAFRSVMYLNSSNNPSTADRTVTWIGTDGSDASLPVTSTITVAATNDGPVITAGGTLAYTEGSPATAIDPLLTVTDPDSINLTGVSIQITANYQSGADVLSFTTIGTISGSFDVPSGTLSLSGTDTMASYETALRAVRYENTSSGPSPAPRTVSWNATDGTTPSNTATSTITIGVINDAPQPSGGPFSIAENSANGSPVGTVAANDPDVGQTQTFNITGGNLGTAFAINSGTGAITVNNSAALDFETTPTFGLTVQVTDNGSPPLNGNTTVTINLTNANDPPVVTPATFSLAENSANATGVGTVTATDPDVPAQTLTFAITGGNTGGAFAINSGTGAITVNTSAALDFETTPSFGLTVQVTDNGSSNLSGTASVTINLTDVNEAPVPTGGPFSLPENSANGTSVGAVAPNDPDASQAHTFSITAGNTGGAFAINATTGAITVATSSALNFETTPAFTLTVQVTDNGSPNLSGAASVTINLTDVNEAPVPSGGPFSLPENSANGTSVGTVAVSDPDIGQTHAFGITGGNTGGAFAINGSGQITVANSAALNFETTPSFTLTVQVTDNGTPVLSGSTTVAVSLTNVNEAPVATAKTHQTHSGIRVTIGAGDTDKLKDGATDPDADDTFATLSVSNIANVTPAGATVALTDPTTGTFTYNPPAGLSGNASASFTFDVCDNGVPDGPSMCDTETVIFNITGPDLWFVQQGASGTGRLTDPLGSLASLPGGRGNGDRIFVFSDPGTGIYGTGHTLNTSEHLIGQGSSGTFDSVLGVTVPGIGTLDTRPALGGTRPQLNGTVTLAGSSTVRGLNIASSTATGLTDPVAAITGVTVSETSVTSTTGTAVNLNSTGGTVGLTAVSANGAANGIVLNTTTGSFTVTGTGTAGSGGTIQNKATGISLTTASNVSLSRMQLNDFTDFAIRGSSVVGFTMDNTVINGTNGSDAGADEGSVRFTELTGSAAISNSSISGTVENNFTVINTASTLNRITFDTVTFGPMSAATGDHALLIESLNSAVINTTVQNSVFTAARGTHINRVLNSSASSDTVFTGNTISNTGVTPVSGGGAAIRLFGGNNTGINPSATFNIANNTMRDSLGAALAVNKTGGSGTFSGTITGNTVGVAAVANSGSSQGSGIFALTDGTGSYTASVTGNTVRQYGNFGIFFQTGGSGVVGSGAMNVTATGNIVSNPGTLVFIKNGVQLNGGVSPGDTYQVCLSLGGAGANAITGTGTDGGTDFRVRQRQATTVRLPGYVGPARDDTDFDVAEVTTFVQANNDTVSVPSGSSASSGSLAGGYSGGAACPLP